MAHIAQYERDLTMERTRAGREQARLRGGYRGNADIAPKMKALTTTLQRESHKHKVLVAEAAMPMVAQGWSTLCALPALSAYFWHIFSQFHKDPYENQNFFRGPILVLFCIVKHFSAGLLKARLS